MFGPVSTVWGLSAHGRRPVWGLLAASVGSLGGALASQFIGGLAPCVLCIWQRWPWLVVGLAMLAALRVPVAAQNRLLALAAAALLVGAGIAGFHVGVEQGWWAGTAECVGGAPTPDSVEALRAQLFAKPAPRCDRPAWLLFGVSMAGWNFALSLALALFAAGVVGARRGQA